MISAAIWYVVCITEIAFYALRFLRLAVSWPCIIFFSNWVIKLLRNSVGVGELCGRCPPHFTPQFNFAEALTNIRFDVLFIIFRRCPKEEFALSSVTTSRRKQDIRHDFSAHFSISGERRAHQRFTLILRSCLVTHYTVSQYKDGWEVILSPL